MLTRFLAILAGAMLCAPAFAYTDIPSGASGYYAGSGYVCRMRAQTYGGAKGLAVSCYEGAVSDGEGLSTTGPACPNTDVAIPVVTSGALWVRVTAVGANTITMQFGTRSQLTVNVLSGNTAGVLMTRIASTVLTNAYSGCGAASAAKPRD